MLVIQQYKGIFLMWCRISLSFHSLHFYSVWFSSIVIPQIAVCLYSENKNLPTVHFPPAQPRDRWEIEQLIFLTGTQLNPVATVKKKKKATHEEWECVFVYVHEIQPQIYTQGVLVQLCAVSQHLGICLCSESNHMITYIVSIQTYSALLRLYFIMADRDKEIKHDINISWEKSVQKKAKTEWDRRAERGGNSKWKKRDGDQRQAAPMALCDKDIM